METNEVKPGYKTSEFWLAAAAQIIGLLAASGAFSAGSMWERVIGLATMALASMGYSASRAATKSGSGVDAMWAALYPVIQAVLEVIIRTIANAEITAKVASRNVARRERLLERVRQRVVLVPPGEPVQLAEPVKTHVYVEVDGQRVRSANAVTLPEGWWCLPDPNE